MNHPQHKSLWTSCYDRDIKVLEQALWFDLQLCLLSRAAALMENESTPLDQSEARIAQHCAKTQKNKQFFRFAPHCKHIKHGGMQDAVLYPAHVSDCFTFLDFKERAALLEGDEWLKGVIT